LTCAFPPLSSSGERPVYIAAEGSPPLCDRGALGHISVGKEKSESGVAEAL